MSASKTLEILNKYPDLDKLLLMWIEDSSPITEINYPFKMSGLASIHAKYLSIFSYADLDYKKMLQNKKILYAKLERYFSGKPNPGEICIDPNLKPKIKTDLVKLIEDDVDYISICAKVDIIEEIRDTAKMILEYIKNHSFTVNKFFDYIRYTNGA